MSRLAARLRRADGFTLIEMLSALVIGSIVLTLASTIVVTTIRKSNDISDRVDALQRGRIAMDTITRQLRSQICLTSSVPAMVAADQNSVTFYADFGDGTTPPEKRTLTYNPTTRQILEDRIAGTGTAPNWTFTGTAKRKVLIDNVERDGSTPIFAYYAFNTATPPAPAAPLGTPVAAASLPNVAKIDIAFVARPARATTTARRATTFHDDVYIRAADPNDPAPTPRCA